MTSTNERFWIGLILRFGFGFLFLFVAVGQFDAGSPIDHGPTFFAETLSKPFASSWLGSVTPDIKYTVHDEKTDKDKEIARDPSYFFLLALPYTFAILSLPILIGVFHRPALRIGAVLLVMLGLGRYISGDGDIGPTTNNFILAFLICVGLYFYGQTDRAKESSSTVSG